MTSHSRTTSMLGGPAWMAAVAAATSLVACDAAVGPPPSTGGAGGGTALSTTAAESSTQGATSASTGTGDTGWTGLPWSSAPCSEATQFVYLVTAQSYLYSYWPPTGQFKRLGEVRCDGQPIAPFSMAIDRHAVGWVETYDAKVFSIDLADGSCKQSPYSKAEGEDRFPQFGMAYASVAGAPDEERLFVRAGFFSTDPNPEPDKRWLGTLDPLTGVLEPIALGPGQDSDLASAKGRLFAFEDTSATAVWSSLVEIDPATAEPLEKTPMPGLTIAYDFATAAWGGDFYFFADDIMGNTSVMRYRPSTGKLTWQSGPLFKGRVVGAGVSTCAPTEPPPK